MVSTRRSRSMTAAEDGSTDGAADAAQPSQPEVSSRRQNRAAATPKRAPAQMQPIEEEGVAAAAAKPAVAADHEEQQQISAEQKRQAAIQQPQRQQRHSQHQQEPEPLPHPAAAAAAAAQAQAASTPIAAAAAAGATLSSSESGSEKDAGDNLAGGSDGEDWDFDGPDMLQSLAATIQSALGTSKQAKKQQQQQQQHRVPEARDAAADDMDVDGLQWRPQTGLQLPRRVAHVVATTAAAHQQQHGEGAAAGPVVRNPAAAAAEEAGKGAAAAEGSAIAAATKPKGLAKQLPIADSKDGKKGKKDGPKTAGKKWYDLPAVEITDDVKRDLRLLRLRGAYDPKRFYKSFDETKFPKHFAIGTVVDDPLDFYGGRLTQGQRKATLTEQLLADQELNTNRKKRYNKLQDEAQKWGKHKKRKTSQPRKQPSKHRPKH